MKIGSREMVKCVIIYGLVCVVCYVIWYSQTRMSTIHYLSVDDTERANEDLNNRLHNASTEAEGKERAYEDLNNRLNNASTKAEDTEKANENFNNMLRNASAKAEGTERASLDLNNTLGNVSGKAESVLLMHNSTAKYENVSSPRVSASGGLEPVLEGEPIRVLLMRNARGGHDAPTLPSMTISPGRSCEFYRDKDRFNETEFVVIKTGLTREKGEIPSWRVPGQKWIYYARESKLHDLKRVPRYSNSFHYTMTYSMHADVFFPYGECVKYKENSKQKLISLDNTLSHKTSMAVWFVSNCGTRSYRENYARELLKYIPIDVYGKCGIPIEGNVVIEKYKFYLAFENSLCGEYITEKLWRSYDQGVLPVVYGAMETYARVLPPHSYIDVSHYASPKQLADYLNVLDSNDTLYREYFSWVQTYNCGKQQRPTTAKNLCNFLHKHRYDNPDTFNVESVWAHWSTRCENAQDYLTNLGVTNLVKIPFHINSHSDSAVKESEHLRRSGFARQRYKPKLVK